MDGVKNNKEMEDIVLLQGNCLEQLRKIPDNSIDMILTEIILLSLIQCRGIIKKCAFAV